MEKRIAKLEIEFKRVNTLEVTMKRFLRMENHFLSISTMNALEKSAIKGKKITQEPEPSKTEELEARIIATVEKRLRTQWFDSLDKLKEQIQLLCSEMSSIKKQILQCESDNKQILEEFNELKKQLKSEKEGSEQPIIYQDIKVERMLIDKYELNNNIAQLGVRDLSGSLNVGATYGTGIIPSDLAEDFLSTMNEFKKEQNNEIKKEKQTDTIEKQNERTQTDTDEEGTDIPIE
ncbi:hypothetical protein V7147_15025 [Bacillus sp. JJ1521]|uniref:hypothetical protein n=1 Tax=Bacillus sp. JJ1521 TaxID=3122957 RepID=UPI003000375C